MSYRSRILGIGMSVPKKVVTNHDLAKLMETSDEWEGGKIYLNLEAGSSLFN